MHDVGREDLHKMKQDNMNPKMRMGIWDLELH